MKRIVKGKSLESNGKESKIEASSFPNFTNYVKDAPKTCVLNMQVKHTNEWERKKFPSFPFLLQFITD